MNGVVEGVVLVDVAATELFPKLALVDALARTTSDDKVVLEAGRLIVSANPDAQDATQYA